MAYLNELHPEVFAMAPRAGGVAKIKNLNARTLPRPSSVKSIQRKDSKSTLKSAAGKSSKVTIRSTTTAGTFDSKFFRPSASTPKKTTREYRIKKVLSSSPWLLFEDDGESDNVVPPDPIRDEMTLLAATISTIMLMAAGHKDIPRQNLVWTQSYLECIKDDHGNHPPNVRGIMNHIKTIDSTLTSFFDELDDDAKSELTGGPSNVPSAH